MSQAPLRTIRTTLGLSQYQLAANIGCSQGAIAHMELGHTTLCQRNMRGLLALCKQRGLPVTLEHVYGWEPLPQLSLPGARMTTGAGREEVS